MRRNTLVLVGVLLSSEGSIALPQIGTIPLLDSLPAEGKCERFAGTAELKHLGETRVMTFTTRVSNRSITVGVGDRGRPGHLVVMAGRPIPPSKSESEMLFARLDESGRVTFWNRTYATLGTPASRSEDRRGGLFATDTSKIELLVKAVVRRCGT